MISTGSSRADELLTQGIRASQDKDAGTALALFNEASVEAPSSGLPHLLIGAELASTGEIDRAEMAFANAVLLSPSLTIARYQLGFLQFCAGRTAVALVTWQPLLDLPDPDPLPHFVRGFAALCQNAQSEALAYYEAGLQRNEDNAPLSADIRRIMSTVQSAATSDGQTAESLSRNAEPAPAENSDGTDQDSHVLLSNYQQRGTFH